jgi:hypothetical protein
MAMRNWAREFIRICLPIPVAVGGIFAALKIFSTEEFCLNFEACPCQARLHFPDRFRSFPEFIAYFDFHNVNPFRFLDVRPLFAHDVGLPHQTVAFHSDAHQWL